MVKLLLYPRNLLILLDLWPHGHLGWLMFYSRSDSFFEGSHDISLYSVHKVLYFAISHSLLNLNDFKLL